MGPSPVYNLHDDGAHEVESGYVSGSSSQADLPEIYFTKPHLAFLNRQLQHLEPQGMMQTSSEYLSQADMVDHRNTTMVHHLPTLPISRNRLRSYWPHHPRHALENEPP